LRGRPNPRAFPSSLALLLVPLELA